MPTAVSLVIAIVMFTGFLTFALFAIVRPAKVADLFQAGGGRADIFTPGGMRFVGVVFLIALPFVAWSAFTQILI